MTAEILFQRLVTIAESAEIRSIDPGFAAWLVRNRDALLGVLSRGLAGRGRTEGQQGPPVPKGVDPERWAQVRPQVLASLQALLNSRVLVLEGYNAEDTHPQGAYAVFRMARGPGYTGLSAADLTHPDKVASAAKRLSELFQSPDANYAFTSNVYKSSKGLSTGWELLSHRRDTPWPRTHDAQGHPLEGTAPPGPVGVPDQRSREIDYHLEQIDAWRSGDKATPGSPATGERYALRMREEIKRHAAALAALGWRPETSSRAAGPWSASFLVEERKRMGDIGDWHHPRSNLEEALRIAEDEIKLAGEVGQGASAWSAWADELRHALAARTRPVTTQAGPPFDPNVRYTLWRRTASGDWLRERTVGGGYAAVLWDEAAPDNKARFVFYPEGVTPPPGRPAISHLLSSKGIILGEVYPVAGYVDRTDLSHPPTWVRFQLAPDGSGQITIERMNQSRRSPPVGPFPARDDETLQDILDHIVSRSISTFFPAVVQEPAKPVGPALAVNTVVAFKGRKGKKYVVVKPGTVVELVALSGGAKGSGPSAVPTSDLDVVGGPPVFEGKEAGQRYSQYVARMAVYGQRDSVLPRTAQAAASTGKARAGQATWTPHRRTDPVPEGMDQVGPISIEDALKIPAVHGAGEAAQAGWEAARRHETANVPPQYGGDRRAERAFSAGYFAAQQAANEARWRAQQAQKRAASAVETKARIAGEEAERARLRATPTTGPTRPRSSPALPTREELRVAPGELAPAEAYVLRHSRPPTETDAGRWLLFRKGLLEAAAAKGDAVVPILLPALATIAAVVKTDSSAGTFGQLREIMFEWLDEATLRMPEYLNAEGEYVGGDSDDTDEAVTDARFRIEHPRAKTKSKRQPPEWAYRFARALIKADDATHDDENAPTVPAIRAFAQWAAEAPEAQAMVTVWRQELAQDWHRQAAARRTQGQAPGDLRAVLTEYGVLPPADMPLFPNRNPRR